MVLVYDTRFHLFPGKFKSRWYGPCKVKKILKSGAIQVQSTSGGLFLVNDQRLKPYISGDTPLISEDENASEDQDLEVEIQEGKGTQEVSIPAGP